MPSLSTHTKGWENPLRGTSGSWTFPAGISPSVPAGTWVWAGVTSSYCPWISASSGFMAKCLSTKKTEVLGMKRTTKHESCQQKKAPEEAPTRKGRWKWENLWSVSLRRGKRKGLESWWEIWQSSRMISFKYSFPRTYLLNFNFCSVLLFVDFFKLTFC